MKRPFFVEEPINTDANIFAPFFPIIHNEHTLPLKIFYKTCEFNGAFFHRHPDLEIFMVTSGSLEFCTLDSRYLIQKNEGIFLNSNEPHFLIPTSCSENTVLLGFVFLPSLIAGEGTYLFNKYVEPLANQPSYPFVHLKGDILWQQDILCLLSRLPEWINDPDEMAEITLRDLCSEIWRSLYQNRQDLFKSNNRNSYSEDFDRLSQMCSYIQNQYNQDILLDDIAKSAFISKSGAIRCFKKNLSMTPHQYLMAYRVMAAKSLLLTTNSSVSDIAMQCGFSNSSHFSHIYQKMTGLLPSEYRSQYFTAL